MSLSDFERCTPLEFSRIIDQYQKKEEDLIRLSWEQTRMLATISLAPYSKKALKPTDVLQFPWDNKNKPKIRKGSSSYERMKEIESRLKRG